MKLVCSRLMVSQKFLVFTYGCSNHPYIEDYKNKGGYDGYGGYGGYSSIGRTTVCGTVSSLFNSGYPPIMY